MKYVYVTKNDTQDTETMNGYVGTSLLHSEADFCIWLWTNPQAPDLSDESADTPAIDCRELK